ncbi:MAG: hypothetical protein OXH45_08910 [Gammaproteobacteria bacterium]|nr:hypothetical protein [Gammaproteobacteria bacterium]
MAYRDVEQRRRRDRERFRERTERRRAAGFCLRCGVRRPENGLALCGECAEKRRASERARDARRRAAGIKRRRNVAGERARDRQRTSERIARAVCTKCGVNPPEPGRRLCAGCGEKRRAADRARYARAKRRGELYGGRNPQRKREAGRAASARRRQACLDGGTCVRCGRRPPVEGGATCQPCRETRQAAERDLYASRRAAGLCVSCGRPAFAGATRCGVCATVEGQRRNRDRKNAASRRRYWERRAAGRCTDCNAPSFGASRCPDCAKRSYERSDFFRGIPVWDPSFTVIELATGESHGPFDTEVEAVAELAFAGLSFEEVEIVNDAPITARYAAWG